MKFKRFHAPFLLILVMSLANGCADETQKDVGTNGMNSILDQSEFGRFIDVGCFCNCRYVGN